MGTPQHPSFKIKTHFLAEKKAPAGMGTPQHPGFKKKHTFWAKKKPLRELRRRNTLVLKEKACFGHTWVCASGY